MFNALNAVDVFITAKAMKPVLHMSNYMIVAEDDVDDRLLIQNALSEVKFPLEVLFMPDGGEVIQHFSICDKLPELLIVDINMPRVTGPQVLEYMKSRRFLETIPVHVMSTSSSSRERNQCMLLGAASFTVKPDSYQDLLNWLTSLKEGIAVRAG